VPVLQEGLGVQECRGRSRERRGSGGRRRRREGWRRRGDSGGSGGDDGAAAPAGGRRRRCRAEDGEESEDDGRGEPSGRASRACAVRCFCFVLSPFELYKKFERKELSIFRGFRRGREGERKRERERKKTVFFSAFLRTFCTFSSREKQLES